MNLEMVLSVVWSLLIVFTIIVMVLMELDMEKAYRTRWYDVVVWVIVTSIPVSGLVLDVFALTAATLPGDKVILVCVSIGVFALGLMMSGLRAWKLIAYRHYQTPEEVSRAETKLIRDALENHKRQSQAKQL